MPEQPVGAERDSGVGAGRDAIETKRERTDVEVLQSVRCRRPRGSRIEARVDALAVGARERLAAGSGVKADGPHTDARQGKIPRSSAVVRDEEADVGPGQDRARPDRLDGHAPDPAGAEPGQRAASANPAGAAAARPLRLLHPRTTADTSSRAPTTGRRRSRGDAVAAGQVLAGWYVLTAGRWCISSAESGAAGPQAPLLGETAQP